MLKKLKHGFTLVELVIVIAVIAVLAAVLIPTFINVIDSANNSADVQLAGNLTTALVDAQVYPDEVASAQNIRKHVKDFGYEPSDLVTKKSSNVIAYNKAKMKVEVLDVSKITADQLVSSYYAEEVISGYIIISTGGNDLAEALYALSNLPGEGTSGASLAVPASSPISPIAASVDDIGNYVANALNKISNSDIKNMVANVVQSTLYVNSDGDMYFIDIDGNTANAKQITQKEDIPQYTLDSASWELPIRSRVAFSEGLKDFDVDKLMRARTALTVILPQTLESISNSYSGTYEDLPTFSGNVSNVTGNRLPSEKVQSVETTKDIIGEVLADNLMGDYTKLYENTILANADQVYTSDFKGDFDTALEIAKKIYDIKTNKGESVKSIRLVVNDNVKVTGSVTIPAYIDVQIPFAIGNSVAKEIMEYNMGNVLGGKPLGSAYPANNEENLNKTVANQLYYLCGEGPGGGTDVMLHNYMFGLTELPDGYNEEATLKIFAASRNISKDEASYSLTVAQNATLNISGNLTVGGVIGYPNAGGYQGHTSGAHGQINNNGTINVQKGGVLDVFGFVEGNGKVNAREGSMVFEPFMVTDYLDTMNTLFLYPFAGFPTGDSQPDASSTAFNSPFMRYAVSNIRADLTLEYGSSLYGRANLMVFGGFLYCRALAPLITSNNYIYDTFKGEYMAIDDFKNEQDWHVNVDGSDGVENGTWFKNTEKTRYMATICGALQLTDKNSSIVCTYDGNKAITISQEHSEAYEYDELCNRNGYAGDIGVVTLALNGNISTSGIKMDLLGGVVSIAGVELDFRNAAIPVDTSWCDLPVPYNFNFTVNGHLTVAENNNFVFMPGAVFTVAERGIVTIKQGAGLYALENYEDSEYLKNWGAYLTSGRISSMKKHDTDGYYYNSLLDTIKPSGEYELVDILQLILGSMTTFAPKYYPSDTLLTANGFNTSAQFVVKGTVTVENGGDLGGVITAEDTATITLQSGAGMGKVLNLGGPYDGEGGFFTMVVGRELKDASGGMSMTIEGIKGLPLEFLSTVYAPCYLSIVDSDNNELTFTENNDYEVSEDQKSVLFNDISGYTNTLENNSTLITTEIDYRNKTLSIKSKYRTAKKEIVVDSAALQAAATAHVKNTTVAYFAFDYASNVLTLKDNTQPAE